MRSMPNTARSRASQQKDPETPVIDPEAPLEEAAVNGVLLLRTFAEDGNADIGIQLLGDVRITEAETIMKMGQRMLTSKLNL